MQDRIYKGLYKFCSLFFVVSFMIMQTGGCELSGFGKSEFAKEVVTITAPLIEEKTEEKIKETSTGSETGSEISGSTECIYTK